MHTRLAISLSLLFIGACNGQNNFPSCPAWTHQLTFVNNGSTSATIKETPGCFGTTLSQPPFNGARCWPLNTAGEFEVKPGASNAVKVNVPSCWSGNFGAKCANCKTGVQTLAEFTFDGGLDGVGQKLPGLIDTYDVSLVDGFTKPLRITPDRNVTPGGGTCTSAGCQSTPTCPLKLVDGDACLSPNQYVIANRSEFTDSEQRKYGCVCSVSTPLACTDNSNHDVPAGCSGQFGCSPFSQPGQTHQDSSCCPFFGDATQKCSATTKDRAWDSWAIDYINTVHKNCPGEYAWQYDDDHGTFTCQGSAQAPMNYTVAISPALVAEPRALRISRVASPAGPVTGVPAPGSLASVYLSGLYGIASAKPSPTGGLPFELAGVGVTVGGTAAPLAAITALTDHHRIDFQVPWEAVSPFPVDVTHQGLRAGITRSGEAGWGVLFAGAQHASDYSLVTAAKPAVPGEWLIVYATNLGAVLSPPPTGQPARSAPLSTLITRDSVVPLIRSGAASLQAETNFIGLTPGSVGIYQINLRVPNNALAGEAELLLQRTETCAPGMEMTCGFKDRRLTYSNTIKLPISTR